MSLSHPEILDVLRLEVYAPDGANHLENHSGEINSSGWRSSGVVPIAVTSVEVSGTPLIGAYKDRAILDTTDTPAALTLLETPPVPVTQSRWVGASVQVGVLAGPVQVNARLTFYDYRGNVLLTVNGPQQTLNFTFPWVATELAVVGPAPAGAAYVRVGAAWKNTEGYTDYLVASSVMVSIGASRASVTGVPFTDYLGWLDLLPQATQLEFSRGNERAKIEDTLAVGILSATLNSPDLDPLMSTRLRPGTNLRVTGLGGGVWRPQWTGRVVSSSTIYSKQLGRSVISLTASDLVSKLLDTPQPVGTNGTFSQQVTLALDGTGILPIIQDDPPLSNVDIVYTDTNAKSLDQIGYAVRTMFGWLWVSSDGALFGHGPNFPPDRAPVRTFTDGRIDGQEIFYTELVDGFSTESIVNSLTVELTDGDTTQSFGPYRSLDSIAIYGERNITYSVTSINDVPVGELLARTAFPERSATEVTADVLDAVDRHLTDDLLYVAANVDNSGSGLDQTVRIIRVSHRVTTAGWSVTYTLRPLEALNPIEVVT